ncbi:MAG TPA: type III polyketide synthase [Elusimicrobiota bacterium]|nr:type III polyketide synthase [Elusimicrobiota bacterium]
MAERVAVLEAQRSLSRRPKQALTRLLGLATATPAHEATQPQVQRFIGQVLRACVPGPDGLKAAAFAERINAASGIERRQGVLADYAKETPEEFAFFPKNWTLDPFPTTAARMKVYEQESVELASRAAAGALREAKIEPREATHLIVATCTGFFAPGPDVMLMEKLGLRPDIKRTILGFMGCYAGFNGMRLADEIIRGNPDAVVLQVCVELCSLHFQKRLSPDLLVANSLFSDGAAAAVYAAADGGRGIADVLATCSYVPSGSLEQMAWRIGDTGFEMRLDRQVPSTLKRHAPAFTEGLLRQANVARDEVAGWAVHPGGRKIVEAIGESMKLDGGSVQSAFDVLRDHGNMSSPTIFFVLDKELRRKRGGPVVALGFGPGLTMEGAALLAS